MLNAEKYREEILEYYDKILCTRFGVDKRTKKIIQCCSQECENCEFSVFEEKNKGTPCIKSTFKWLLSEYKEPIKLTRLEYDILKYLSDNTKHMYIVRNKDGKLCIFDFEPVKNKVNDWWSGRYMYGMVMFNKLFQFVQWEDSTPTPIKDVLNNCEVVNDAEE